MAGKKMNEVTQADRDRAWPFRPEGYGPDSKLDWDSGVHDGNRIIQAFRDHRVAAAKAMQEACAERVEADLMLSFDGYDLTGFAPENHRLRVVATAIRALNQEETP